jgi:hypothetical protein
MHFAACILCTAKDAMRDYHEWYPDWRQPNRNVFAMVHHSMTETGRFMPLAHTGCGRCNEQNEEEVFRSTYTVFKWFLDIGKSALVRTLMYAPICTILKNACFKTGMQKVK